MVCLHEVGRKHACFEYSVWTIEDIERTPKNEIQTISDLCSWGLDEKLNKSSKAMQLQSTTYHPYTNGLVAWKDTIKSDAGEYVQSLLFMVDE